MTANNDNTKKKNNRFTIKSNVKELLTEYFIKNYEGKHYSDMYEDIAEYCGISPSTVGQMRLKNLAPSYIVAVKLSELLEVEPTEIWEVVEMEENEKTEQRQGVCRVFGCDRVSTTRGYCMKHVYFSKNDIEKERGNTEQ